MQKKDIEWQYLGIFSWGRSNAETDGNKLGTAQSFFFRGGKRQRVVQILTALQGCSL